MLTLMIASDNSNPMYSASPGYALLVGDAEEHTAGLTRIELSTLKGTEFCFYKKQYQEIELSLELL